MPSLLPESSKAATFTFNIVNLRFSSWKIKIKKRKYEDRCIGYQNPNIF
jgi:hypothetical protein